MGILYLPNFLDNKFFFFFFGLNNLHSIIGELCYIRYFLISWDILYWQLVGWFMLNSFEKKALSCRNLVDQSHQGETGMATTWWKLISVPVSPDLVVVHTHHSPRWMGVKESSPFQQVQCLFSLVSDRTLKGFQPHCPKCAFELYSPSEGDFLTVKSLHFRLRKQDWSRLKSGC